MELIRVELTVLILFHYQVFAETLFSISHATRYRMQTFQCPLNDDCRFECNNVAVTGSTTYIHSSCVPTVTNTFAHGSCECSQIYCPGGGYKCYFGCNMYNSCYYNQMYCGNDSICNIHCNDTRSCNYASVHCGDNSECNLYCHGTSSCQSMTFYCGTNSNCTISCNGGNGAQQECYGLKVIAEDSKSLSIDVYNNYRTAKDIYIKAPNTDSSSPTIIRCGIPIYNSAGSQESCGSMNIYAVEGWNDVELQLQMTATDIFGDYNSAEHQMHCGKDYEFFCFGWAINGNLMQCDSDITICNTYTLN